MPSIEISTIGPWCAGDSRAYHQPTAAEAATAMKKSPMMSEASQGRVLACGRVAMSYLSAAASALTAANSVLACSLSGSLERKVVYDVIACSSSVRRVEG